MAGRRPFWACSACFSSVSAVVVRRSPARSVAMPARRALSAAGHLVEGGGVGFLPDRLEAGEVRRQLGLVAQGGRAG